MLILKILKNNYHIRDRDTVIKCFIKHSKQNGLDNCANIELRKVHYDKDM